VVVLWQSTFVPTPVLSFNIHAGKTEGRSTPEPKGQLLVGGKGVEGEACAG